MSTTIFPTSLFDFDFTADEKPIGKDYDSIDTLLARRKWLGERLSPAPDTNPLAPRTNDLEELSERLSHLRTLAERALDEERMGAYFRLLDSIEAYEPTASAEPKARPADYGIPEVKLTYANDCRKNPQIKSSYDIEKYLRESYDKGEIGFREIFKVAYLNSQNKILGIQTVGVGGLAMCPADVRVIFTGALLAHATGIVVCHNHPSGNLKTSAQDDNLTKRIKEAGKLLEIPLLDHIVLAPEGFFSYHDNGRL